MWGPEIGFIASWCVFWAQIWIAYGILPSITVGAFGNSLYHIGAMTENQGLMSIGIILLDKNVQLVGAIVLIILMTILTILPWKYAKTFTYGGWAFFLFFGITMGLTFLLHPWNPRNFQTAWDGLYGSGTYNEIMSIAQAHGWDPGPTFSWGATFAAMTATIWSYGTIGAQVPSMAGEIKNHRKTCFGERY
jgi:hypothetical protein